MQSFLKEGTIHETLPNLWYALLSKSQALLSDTRKIGRDLDALSALLSQIDSPTSSLLNSVDLKAGDLSTYYFAAFSAGMDVDASLSVYRIVKNLVRYVLFADRYYETGAYKAFVLSRQMLANAKKEGGSYLRYSIPWSIRQFTPFWQFEQSVKRRMLKGIVFTPTEIAHHNLYKSSDARHIYAAVLEAKLTSYDQNVASVLHYNQALQDIYDDLNDIGEDLVERMPNIFIMASSGTYPFAELSKLSQDDAERTILRSKAFDTIMHLAESHKKSVDEIALPKEFRFLKTLSSHYFQTISLAMQSKSPTLARET